MIRAILASAALVAAQAAMARTTTITSAARSPGALATARQLVGMLGLERTLDTMFSQLMPAITASTISTMERAPGAPQSFKLLIASDEGRRRATAVMSDELVKSFRARYPQIAEATAAEYAHQFTEPELTSTIAFYKSPAGAKMLTLQPLLQQRLSEQGRNLGMAAGVEALPRALRRLDISLPKGR